MPSKQPLAVVIPRHPRKGGPQESLQTYLELVPSFPGMLRVELLQVAQHRLGVTELRVTDATHVRLFLTRACDGE